MKRLLILVITLVVLGLHVQPAQSADATVAWNQIAASYHFSTTYGGFMNSTFAQAYHGSDFSTEFPAILSAVAQVMGTEPPPYGGGDVMSASLQNWPNP